MKEFFLGAIAVVLLYLLWRKDQRGGFGAIPGGVSSPQPSPGTCGGCSSPSVAAAPSAQMNTWALLGMDGQISPGTPPLQGATGVGSFYGPDGPTPDTTFTNIAAPVPVAATATIGPNVGNVPGSPTTPSTIVPVRATQPVGSYADTGFQQRYNVVGVPRVYAAKMNWVM